MKNLPPHRKLGHFTDGRPKYNRKPGWRNHLVQVNSRAPKHCCDQSLLPVTTRIILKLLPRSELTNDGRDAGPSPRTQSRRCHPGAKFPHNDASAAAILPREIGRAHV